MSEESMEEALKEFGWTCGKEFWARYHSDPWVFNLANAVERLYFENDKLAELVISLRESLKSK